MRSLSWRLILRAVTVLSWMLAILWFLAEPGYEPLIAVLAGIGTLVGSFAASDAPITEYKPTPEQRQRNRRTMLELVRSFWVEGVLEQSLHNAAMIELGMEEKPGAVEHPWDMVLQTDRGGRVLPAGTDIIHVFDEMGGSLLILGEPGSGKTTMLLELARDTIARAEDDLTQPIPVVFNLSSWAAERQPIEEWLVDELNAKYNIPKEVARPWVESNELLLLLDGLDEVALKCREDCVKAINKFRQHHLVPLVVCSRVADYEALTARLRLQGAVLLQPLAPQQIDDYLDGAGVALLAVRGTLKHDPTLQELAETPLMLSIMTLAYKGVSVEDLQALDTVEARRKHLFDSYVQRMFERRGADQPYPPRQTIHWLAWLAHKMSEHAQSEFLIEGLQPDWLSAHDQRRACILARLVFAVIVGLVFGLVLGLVSGPVVGLSVGTAGLVGGLVYGMDRRGWLTERLGGPPLKDSVETVEALNWSWQKFIKTALLGSELGGLIGLLLIMLDAELSDVVTGRSVNIVRYVGIIVLCGLGAGLSGGLYAALDNTEVPAKTKPNQGIRQSAANAITCGLGYGLPIGLACWLAANLCDKPVGDLLDVLGVIGGLYTGVGGGLVYWGGWAVVLHFALRCILSHNGHLDWNLVRFLDYAAERIFLRKVGGGYIFIHRLLQDHFASLYQDQSDAPLC